MSAANGRDLRRWVSIAEVLRLLPGRDAAVRRWLEVEGLLVTFPWNGRRGVDLQAVYQRIEAQCQEPVETLPVVEPLHPGRIERPRPRDLEAVVAEDGAAAPPKLRRGKL